MWIREAKPGGWEAVWVLHDFQMGQGEIGCTQPTPPQQLQHYDLSQERLAAAFRVGCRRDYIEIMDSHLPA